jgi:glycosyltransferase involved in cell wall biosynthesis
MEGDIPLPDYVPADLWLGLRELQGVHHDNGLDDGQIIEALMQAVSGFAPDVVIVGNLHGAGWPLEALLELRTLDAALVVYMHDLFMVTGRCTYPGDCSRYLTGCDSACPTRNEFPWLAADRIAGAWEVRRRILCGPEGIPLAVNSAYVLESAKSALSGLRRAAVVYYGLDERLFSPLDRSLARRLVGVPPDAFVVLSGAVNVGDRRKGWHIFQKVVSRLKHRVYFLVFGEESRNKKGVHAVGLLRDYRKMPLVYSAADLFVATSLEEALGQTVLEASACRVPVVAFGAGGIPEVARNGLNARVLEERTADALVDAIEELMTNPEQRSAMGAAGREMIESEFTLRDQGQRWTHYLATLDKA